MAGFIDVETTGLSPHTEEVVEFALILFAFDRVQRTILGIIDQYVGLREPSKPIPSDAVRIHGITDDDVRGCCLDDERVEAMLARCEFLVAHNAPFDRGFVARLFPSTAKIPWMCSMRDVDWHGHGCRSRALQALLSAHGVGGSTAHRGLADAAGALRLLQQRGASGKMYFAELLEVYETRHGMVDEGALGQAE